MTDQTSFMDEIDNMEKPSHIDGSDNINDLCHMNDIP
jgi:hypothetical protein